jgi:hexosaminidase
VADVDAAFHRDLVASIRARTDRKVGAWEEAAFAGGVLPGDGYVVAWRDVEASRRLAALGYDVVVAPGQAYYLDMAIDDDWWSRGMGWAGSTSLEDVCAFDPEAGWSPNELSHLLGLQACLWTECVHTEQNLDELLFPRLDAIAERAWSGTVAGGARSLQRRALLLPRVTTGS